MGIPFPSAVRIVATGEEKTQYVSEGWKGKNVFQCFSCGRHGNMLDLYLDQKAGYVGVDRYKRAYADLRDALEKGHMDYTTKKRMEETDRKTEKTKAPVNVLDHTYRSLLRHLTLQTIDRLDLQRRMLTDAEDRGGIVSVLCHLIRWASWSDFKEGRLYVGKRTRYFIKCSR